MDRPSVNLLDHAVEGDSEGGNIPRHGKTRWPKPRQFRWTRMKVEALARVQREDVRRDDDTRTERDNSDRAGAVREMPPQIADAIGPPEPAAGESTDARPEELSFRGVHEQNDKVVANER
jgi:hypothetical protein